MPDWVQHLGLQVSWPQRELSPARQCTPTEFIEHEVQQDWSNAEYGHGYLNILAGQTMLVYPAKEEQGWAWGRL